ncbi:hypothetical protein [Priestia aryabhattai]|uniref:hypothetical protein n=1 Tax=Priestia aryabhattai TaxID=412384 RepID=UPI003D2B36F4
MIIQEARKLRDAVEIADEIFNHYNREFPVAVFPKGFKGYWIVPNPIPDQFPQFAFPYIFGDDVYRIEPEEEDKEAV